VLAVVPASFSATTIHQVDFTNFKYLWNAPNLGVPDTWTWLPGKPTSTARLIGGKHDFSLAETPAGTYQGVHLTFVSVTYGDLNDDGEDDAAVELSFSTGGTVGWRYLFVFTLRNGKPTLLGRLQSGARADGGLVRVAIAQGFLVLDFEDTNRRVGDCCSEGYVRVRYRWQGGVFVASGPPEFGDLNLRRH
jgi:hypothetical protein